MSNDINNRVSKNITLGDCINPWKGKMIAVIVIGMVIGAALFFGGWVAIISRPQAQFTVSIDDHVYIEYYEEDSLVSIDRNAVLTNMLIPFYAGTTSNVENNAIIQNLLLFSSNDEIKSYLVAHPEVLDIQLSITFDIKMLGNFLIIGMNDLNLSVTDYDLSSFHGLNGLNDLYTWIDLFVSFQLFSFKIANINVFTNETGTYNYLHELEQMIVFINPLLTNVGDGPLYFSNHIFSLYQFKFFGVKYNNTDSSIFAVDVQLNNVNQTITNLALGGIF